MWKMLNVYYQILISVITKIEESLNLNLAEPSEWKALPFDLVWVNENFKKQLLVDAQLIQELS